MRFCPNRPQYGCRGYCNRHIKQVRLREAERGQRFIGLPVDATPVLHHLERLHAAGLGTRRIAELTGLTSVTIRVIKRQERVHPHTAARILAVSVPDIPHHLLADNALVPSTGSARRLQALVAIGHTQEQIAARLGIVPNAMAPLIFGRRHVTAGMARRIEAVYRDLQMVAGPSDFARRRARRNGWVPPLAWDEDTIDDPAARSAGVPEPTGRIMPDFAEIVADHRRLDRTNQQIADALGLKLSTFERRLGRYGIPLNRKGSAA